MKRGIITLQKQHELYAGKSRKLSPAQLAALIAGAQRLHQPDIDALCCAFRPLICKLAHRSYVVSVLGEDSENIAWEVFLKFILKYRGRDYAHLPGLIRAHIHYELMAAAAGCAAGRRQSAPDYDTLCSALADEDHLARTELRCLLRQAMGILTRRQRFVLSSHYLYGVTLAECGKLLGKSAQSVSRIKLRALSRLRDFLN